MDGFGAQDKVCSYCNIFYKNFTNSYPLVSQILMRFNINPDFPFQANCCKEKESCEAYYLVKGELENTEQFELEGLSINLIDPKDNSYKGPKLELKDEYFLVKLENIKF